MTPPGNDLTGIWQGLYAYPKEGFSVSFTATLLESGSWLSGSVHESAEDDFGEWVEFRANLIGKRLARAVQFTKTYDGRNGWSHSVDYEGELNDEATEIAGRWSIEGVWSGKFLMIRPGAAEIALKREAPERA